MLYNKKTTKSSLLILCLLILLTITESLRFNHQQQQHQVTTYDSLVSKYDTTTTTSQSSSQSDYTYSDNLNSPNANYYYGSITKQSYQMSVKLQKLDGSIQCEALLPYAKRGNTGCMSCSVQKPLFNLGTRQCQQCKPHVSIKCDAMFNYTTPTTTTTTTTVNNTQTNTTTKPTISNTTQSNTIATNTTKTTNNTSYVIEWQPKPKTNQTNNTTTINNTNNNEIIDIFQPVPVTNNNDDTLHQNYTIDYRVVNNQTISNNQLNNQTLIAKSVGQNATFYTQQCPTPTPYYNPTTKTCQNCKENQQYVPSQKKCLPIIFVSNPKTKYVILKEADQLLKANLNITQSYPERTVRFCDIDKPLAVNGVCIACPAEKIFNFTSQECQDGCPQGQVFSESNSQCINATFLTNSDAPNLLSPIRDFQTFRSAQKLKIKSSPTIVQCPLTKPIFINKKCSTCPDGYPYFNIESQSCETCQRNRNYNQYTRRCEAPSDSGLEIKKIVPNIF